MVRDHEAASSSLATSTTENRRTKSCGFFDGRSGTQMSSAARKTAHSNSQYTHRRCGRQDADDCKAIILFVNTAAKMLLQASIFCLALTARRSAKPKPARAVRGQSRRCLIITEQGKESYLKSRRRTVTHNIRTVEKEFIVNFKLLDILQSKAYNNRINELLKRRKSNCGFTPFLF